MSGVHIDPRYLECERLKAEIKDKDARIEELEALVDMYRVCKAADKMRSIVDATERWIGYEPPLIIRNALKKLHDKDKGE